MNKSTQVTERLQELEIRARALARQNPEEQGIDPAAVEVTRLLEDLRTYQIELELQNEELRSAQQGLIASRRRYQYLFEQLPMPALVVEARGLIEESNERANALLGAFRLRAEGDLDNRLFKGLSRDDRMRLHVALRDVRHGEPLLLRKLAVAIESNPGLIFDAHLIQMSQDYHLDTRVLVILVDRSAEAAREKDQRFFSP